jgi:plastocyanin
MRPFFVVVAVMLASACSGPSPTADTPLAPSPAVTGGGTQTPPPLAFPTDAVTVDITNADAPGGHFNPNPIRVMVGAVVYWRNVDVIPHRIVARSAALDTGDIAPGASSAPVLIPDAGGAYFCAYHPATEGIAVRQ